MKVAKGEFKSGDQKLTVKAAKRKLNKQRDWPLRKAEALLKSSATNRLVKLEWSDRNVTVDGIPAFVQQRNDLRGTFADPFATIQLPQ